MGGSLSLKFKFQTLCFVTAEQDSSTSSVDRNLVGCPRRERVKINDEHISVFTYCCEYEDNDSDSFAFAACVNIFDNVAHVLKLSKIKISPFYFHLKYPNISNVLPLRKRRKTKQLNYLQEIRKTCLVPTWCRRIIILTNLFISWVQVVNRRILFMVITVYELQQQ